GRASSAVAVGRNLDAVAVYLELEPERYLVSHADDTDHGRRLAGAGEAIHLAAEGRARVLGHARDLRLHALEVGWLGTVADAQARTRRRAMDLEPHFTRSAAIAERVGVKLVDGNVEPLG